MSRWEPNARGRLEQAALELYRERGYEQTTVAEIAKRAGLTERTFFRHFADKREVLFPDASPLEHFFVDTLNAVPAAATPFEAMAAVLAAVAALFRDRHEPSRQRRAVIAANAELQERELVKLASLAAALAGTLRERGTAEPAASLTAETAVAVFRVAFDRWTSEEDETDLARIMRDCLDELRALTALSGAEDKVSRTGR